MPSFKETLKEHQIKLTRTHIDTLQVNIGKRCNQACHHCHVEAGPNRTENMTLETIDHILALLRQSPDIHTVDITGGAPELNPHFKYFVHALKDLERHVIDRCNLTVLFEEGQEDTANFLKEHHVEIIASLPCYLEDNVDEQRGKGVFVKSVDALRLLNKLGYGKEDKNLPLNLVYNPVGTHLPPAQASLEQDYKQHLFDTFGIVFNQLFTITNMPIKRFRHMLARDGQLERYMQLLIDHFNPDACNNVMCRNLISIGYDGHIYDCDFNQMLEIPIQSNQKTLWDIDSFDDITQDITVANHCYGCTAGAGSSCGGALIK